MRDSPLSPVGSSSSIVVQSSAEHDHIRCLGLPVMALVFMGCVSLLLASYADCIAGLVC